MHHQIGRCMQLRQFHIKRGAKRPLQASAPSPAAKLALFARFSASL
jgi:hypothetical protein